MALDKFPDALTPIIVSHYKAVRDEEMERIRQRERYIVFTATAYGAIFAFGFSQSEHQPFVLIPFLNLIFVSLYTHTDITIGALSLWLRENYSKTISDFCQSCQIDIQVDHWDGSASNTL